MELYMKGNKTTEISTKMKMYISQNLDNYDYTTKSDIIDDHTFVKHVLFEKTSQEITYVYHYDPGVREYICLCTDKDPINLIKDNYAKKSIADYICAQLKPMFETVNEFNIVDKQESTDNTRYEHVIISDIVKSAILGKHDINIFPIERVVYQSAEAIVVLFMPNFSKCMIIGFDTEHTKKYNYRPDQEIIELIYQDLQSILVDKEQEVIDNANNNSELKMIVDNLILEQKAKMRELKRKSKKKNKNDGLETLTF